MKLVNTDGMAFIGPGSEWFWTAVSGLVLAATFIAIYRQLRLQRSSAAFGQLAALQLENRSEAMCRARLKVLVAIRDGVEPKDLPPAVGDLLDYWARLGQLLAAGHVDRAMALGYLAWNFRVWWALLEPRVTHDRTATGEPDLWREAAALANMATDYLRRHGASSTFDVPFLDSMVATFIASNSEAIEAFEDLRAVSVRITPSPLPVVSSRGGSVEKATTAP